MNGSERTKRRRVAVITGGTQGIGRATAQALAREGWAVAVLGRGEARLRATETELAGLGSPSLAIRTDVADAGAVDAAAARIEQDLGPIDVWVNNAMATVIAPAGEISPAEWRRVTDVTYHGTIFGTLAALRHMRARNRGHIIQISSGIAVRPAPLQAAYCGAKAAVIGFTDSLRSEFIHDGVKVDLTVMYLPAVNTPQFDRSRNHTGHAQNAPDPVYDPRLCADAILAAVRAPSREVWVGRSVLEMVAAQALAPGFADQKAAKMWEAQLRPTPPATPDGNLFEPLPGDAGVDGPFGDRVKPTRQEFFTSRARDVATAGVTGAVGLVSRAAGSLRSTRQG